MDQCMYCNCKGNEDKCYETDCSLVENWIVKHLQLKLRQRGDVISDIVELLDKYERINI